MNWFDPTAEPGVHYSFQPRWKEELVCSCALGSFILEMPMGIVSVYLPTPERWQAVAPDWAKAHWSTLQAQLSNWCASYRYPLYVDATAQVYSLPA